MPERVPPRTLPLMTVYPRIRGGLHTCLAGVPILVGLFGCGDRAAIEVTVADSAGVRVVTSHAEATPLPPAFRLGAAPVADLAAANPDGPALQGVRGGVITPDGGAVVWLADGTLHGFGPGGRLRWQRSPSALGIAPGPGDSVTVLVAPGDRLRVVGPGGGGREVALAWTGRAPLGAVLPLEGGFVALTGWSTGVMPSDAQPGLRADSAQLLRFGPRGRLRDTLTSVIGSEVGVVSIAGRISLVPPHYPRLTLVAARGGRLVVGTGEEDAVVVRAADGSVRAVARIVGREFALSERERDDARQFRERLVSGNPVTRSLAADLDRQLPMPAARPPYARLVVDDEGRVWAAEYPVPGEPSGSWSVFDADLALAGQLALPPGARLLDVAYGRALLHAPLGQPTLAGLYDLLPP